MRSVTVGVLGLGTVGAGTISLLRQRQAQLARDFGLDLQVRKIAVRDLQRPRAVEVDPDLLTTDLAAVIADPEIEIIIELIGGIDLAATAIMAALQAGKHVITANKAVLAERGSSLFAAAMTHERTLLFEGAVAAGLPLIRSLRDGLASDQITMIAGIINGTANYILDAMTRTGQDFTAALQAAQAAGYAEADPSLDIGGGDAAHKLALLALVGFGVAIPQTAIACEGISSLTAHDIRAAHNLGYTVKSLAVAHATADGQSLRVHPTLVPHGHLLADVRETYNAVLVESEALGRSFYCGRGAGMLPTAVGVVSDLIELARNIATGLPSRPPPLPGVPLALAGQSHENYLCFHVEHRPGVLGQIATILGQHGVSISRMLQNPPDTGLVPLVILTEACTDAAMTAALEQVMQANACPHAPTRIRILPAMLR